MFVKHVGADEPACKPDSVPHREAVRRRPSIWAHRRRVPRAAYPQARASSPRAPAQPHSEPEGTVRPLGLASGGVYRAIPVARDAGALLPHRFTLTTDPENSGSVAVCSLWHCPASHPGLPLAITLLCEVRTFLDPWTLRPGAAAARPTRPRVQRSAPGRDPASAGSVGPAVDQPAKFDRRVFAGHVEHVKTADPVGIPTGGRPFFGW